MSERLRIGVFGAGRLGNAIAAAAGDALAWQATRDVPPRDRPADVAIEASSGLAVPQRVAWALETRTPLVIGSTGWELPDLGERVGRRIGVVVAPNFSLAVALLRRFALVLGRFCAQDASRDPFLFEHHHARKADAPSGTARMLAAALLEGCPRKRDWRVGGPLHPEDLAIAVLRAGTTYSEHTVGMTSPVETIELRHRGEGPQAYAGGALAAARWIRSRKGVFTMDDVAASELDPLFAGVAPAEPSP